MNEAHIPVGNKASADLYGVRQEFGCFTKLRGLFQKQLADGIIGLAPRGMVIYLFSLDLSFIGMYKKHIDDLSKRNPHNTLHYQFAFCFIEGGGFMTLGGIDESVLLKPLCYTPFSSLDRYYRVNMNTVKVGDQRGYLDMTKWNQ